MSGNGCCTSTNVIKGGILIGFATSLGCGLSGILTRRNFNRSSRLPITTIGVIGTHQMMFTNDRSHNFNETF
jgi:hypothetical protein